MSWFIHNTHKLCAFYVNINDEGNETVKRVNNLANKKKKNNMHTHTHAQMNLINALLLTLHCPSTRNNCNPSRSRHEAYTM